MLALQALDSNAVSRGADLQLFHDLKVLTELPKLLPRELERLLRGRDAVGGVLEEDFPHEPAGAEGRGEEGMGGWGVGLGLLY